MGLILSTLLPALLLAASLLLAACGGAGAPTERDNPATQRTDLLIGYYGSYADQVAETRDHVNLHWSTHWESEAKRIADIAAMARFTVLDVDNQLYHRDRPKRLRADAADQLRAFFERLRQAGVLQHVKAMVPIDEPNLPENAVGDTLPEAVRLMRAVAAEFAELQGVQIWCLYYNGNPHPNPELFDAIGFDDYPMGARILNPGWQVDQLIGSLRPGQRVFLVPGGSYGQDPAPFVAYAMRRPEVAAIVTFLWHYPPHGEGLADVRSLPVRAAYEAAGRQLTESSK